LCLSHSMPQIIVPTHNPTVNKNSILYSFHIHAIEYIKISYYALDDLLGLHNDPIGVLMCAFIGQFR
jgi:hypothetical protein